MLGCAIPLFLETNTTPSAYTDFEKIVIYSGILRVARTDAQLATVVGHELAHVNMGHYRKQLRDRRNLGRFCAGESGQPADSHDPCHFAAALPAAAQDGRGNRRQAATQSAAGAGAKDG